MSADCRTPLHILFNREQIPRHYANGAASAPLPSYPSRPAVVPEGKRKPGSFLYYFPLSM